MCTAENFKTDINTLIYSSKLRAGDIFVQNVSTTEIVKEERPTLTKLGIGREILMFLLLSLFGLTLSFMACQVILGIERVKGLFYYISKVDERPLTPSKFFVSIKFYNQVTFCLIFQYNWHNSIFLTDIHKILNLTLRNNDF